MDLDGDGQAEWIVPVKSPTRTTSDAIFCFTRSGAVKWSVRPDQRLTLTSRAIVPPWALIDYAVSPDPPRRLWASFTATGGGFSIVIQIDQAGSAALWFVHRGALHSIRYWKTHAGGFLVAGGISAEHGQPTIALMGEDDSASTFPIEASVRPSCADCPVPGPRRVFLFARSELESSFNPRTYIRRFVHTGTDLSAEIRVGDIETARVRLRPDFSVASFIHTPQNWRAHKELESQKRLSHTEEKCPDPLVSKTYREWTPTTGWMDHQIRP
jgi:hypothetical protein